MTQNCSFSMKLVNFTYDDSSSLVRRDIDITGKNLEFVKQGVKSVMRAACIKNKIEEFKTTHPHLTIDNKNLPTIVAEHPELIALENWQVLAIDEYVERLFV